MNTVKQWIKTILKHKFFILLLVFAAVIRFIYINDSVIPFSFDHGKDSIAILHLISVPKLKFIGPWTSIPGLYFGPGWYYLLAPFYLASNFNPVSGAVAMIILVLFQIILVYKYFGIHEAVILSATGFWLMISMSAWNPFPMTFITILILILLKKQLQEEKTNSKTIFLLFLVASAGFHFSAAFAIFYPIIIIAILGLNKFLPTKKFFLNAILGFSIPFVPQILFEIKNSFLEVKAVISYFSTGGSSNKFSIDKIFSVLDVTLREIKNSFAFNISEVTPATNNIIFSIFIALLIFYFIKHIKNDDNLKSVTKQTLIFFLIPLIGFFFLHFNVWYVMGFIPAIVVFFGTLLRKTPKFIQISYLSLLIISAISSLYFYQNNGKEILLKDPGFLPVKLKIIDYIRSSAGDKEFSVFTYVPDIYDYPYQYLFITQSMVGKKLPIKFTYKNEEVAYIKEKEDLLKNINKSNSNETAEIIFFIVHNEEIENILKTWWNHQNYSEIINEQKFGNSITVYTAYPEEK